MRNPCETCGCTCKDVEAIETADIETTTEASRYLRSRFLRRRNPGWSFRQGRAVPHEQKLENIYQRPASRRLGRRSVSPWRRNPCGTRRHRTTRNPDCWMCDDTGYKGNDLCHCPAGNARSGANRYFRNPSHLTHKYCRDDRKNPNYLPALDDSRVCDDCLGDDPNCSCRKKPVCDPWAGYCGCGFCKLPYPYDL